MKKVILSIVLMAVIAFTVNAQKPQLTPERLEMAKKMTATNLKSDYNGIVESTLFGVMLMKKHYPNEDYSNIIENVNELSVEGNSAEIKYKAQLTAMYLSYNNMFDELDFAQKEKPEMYFRAISDKISNNLLTSK